MNLNPTITTSTPDELLSQLVNWQEFWNQDHKAEDWIAYPLIARGRQTALFAVAKEGKSYIALACVAALATGKPIFGRPAQDQVHVLYLDYEMTAADLMERLDNLGYTREDNLTHLHYALIPSLPPLNTYEGAAAVMKLVELTQAQVVVIDTTGRAVEGEENSADTYREFARTTGLALKAKGVALLRTDHAGKDQGKTHGQRGSSAKNDDVDIVYRMSREETTITLDRVFTRIGWAPATINIIEDPDDEEAVLRLKHDTLAFTEEEYSLARLFVERIPGIRAGTKPPGRPALRKLMKEHGIKARNDTVGKALRAIEHGRLRDPMQP
jgi:RecA-family ATPase